MTMEITAPIAPRTSAMLSIISVRQKRRKLGEAERASCETASKMPAIVNSTAAITIPIRSLGLPARQPLTSSFRTSRKSSPIYSPFRWVWLRLPIYPAILHRRVLKTLDPLNQPRRLLVRMIAGPHQRPRLHVAEANLERLGLQLGELARRIEPGHGQVIARGAQILTDGQNVATGRGQIAEDLEQLGGLLAQAHHHAGLGKPRGPQPFGVAQQLQAPLIPRPRAHRAVEPRHRLDVVIKHLRPRLDHHPNSLPVALEVRDEHFDAARGRLAANLFDDQREGARPAQQGRSAETRAGK